MNQTTLQTLLDSAKPTDVIQLPSEVFNFPIVISRPCTVIGSGTIIDVSEVDFPTAVTILANGVIFTDCSIRNKVDAGYISVLVSNVTTGSFERLELTGNIGLSLESCKNIEMTEIVSHDANVGIRVANCNQITLDGCQIYNNAIGVDMVGDNDIIGDVSATQEIRFTYVLATELTSMIGGVSYGLKIDGVEYVIEQAAIPSYIDLIDRINALPTVVHAELTALGILFTSANPTLAITDGTVNVPLLSTISATILPSTSGLALNRKDRTQQLSLLRMLVHDNAIGMRIVNSNMITATDCQVYSNSNIGIWQMPNSYGVVFRGEIYSNSNYGIKNTDKAGSVHVLDASETWWGDMTGPSQFGPGTGDKISTDVIYANPRISGTEPNLTYPITRDFIWDMLGSPVIKVELSEAQVSTCINKAIQRYMQFKTPEPTYYYMDLSMHGGNGMVELPVFIPKEEIIEVTYSPNIDTFTFAQGGGDIFMSYFMQMNNGQLLTDIYIAMSYKETYQRVLGIQPTYELVSGRNSNGDVRDFIRLHPVPTTAIKMALLYNRAISEKEADQVAWIHKYALTWAKEILGRTRSKYSSVPGPTGEITLDGNALLQEAFTDREKLDSELVLVSEPLGFSMG